MSNVSSSNGIEKYPKLRFPEFKEPWTTTQLSNFFKKNIQKNSNGTITNVISNSAKNGLIPQKEYFDKDIANADNTSGYYIISKNDFVYNPRKSSDAPYGPISRYTYDEDGIVSPLYLCFRGDSSVNPKFFEKYFKSPVWHRYVYMSGDSGARHDRVSIKDDTFFEMPINMPCNEEQNKISSFLALVEQKIEAQTILVENLKKYKRGLLKSIFSQEIQFEYQTSWEQRPFSDVAILSKSKYTPKSTETLPCIELEHIEQQTGRIIGNTASNEQNSIKSVFHKGDVLFGKLRPYLKKFALPDFDGVCSSEIWVLHPTKDIDSAFLFYLVQSEGFISAANISSGTKMPRAEWSKVSNENFFVPELKEQKHISQFLLSLDNRIVNTATCLDELYYLKKALLQELFI